MFKCLQGVGPLRESTDDGLTISGQGSLIGFDRGFPVEPQGSAVKQRLSEVGGHAPDVSSTYEQIEQGLIIVAVRTGQTYVWKQTCRGHTDFGAVTVQLSFGRQDVRALMHQFGRQAHGN